MPQNQIFKREKGKSLFFLIWVMVSSLTSEASHAHPPSSCQPGRHPSPAGCARRGPRWGAFPGRLGHSVALQCLAAPPFLAARPPPPPPASESLPAPGRDSRPWRREVQLRGEGRRTQRGPGAPPALLTCHAHSSQQVPSASPSGEGRMRDPGLLPSSGQLEPRAPSQA